MSLSETGASTHSGKEAAAVRPALEVDEPADNPWAKVTVAFDNPPPVSSIDWGIPTADLELQDRLVRLVSIHADLPPNNAVRQKDQHNITLENYKKLALVAAGDVTTLNIFLEILKARLESGESHPKLSAAVFDIWAETAEIIGRHDIKTDLEELAFEQSMPEEKQKIVDEYAHLGGDEAMQELMNDYQEVLTAILAEELGPGVRFRIEGRRKSYYSVWRKVKKDDRPSYALPDFLGLRIIIESTEDEAESLGHCYRVGSLISELFTPDLTRYKDYLANPKTNGYRSLHLTVSDLGGAKIEVQIRTDDMHKQAESDPRVSHRTYDASNKITPGKYWKDLAKPHRIYAWRDKAATSIQQNLEAGNEDLNNVLEGNVLVFSLDGNLYELGPHNTALDFAFAVHTRQALKTWRIQEGGEDIDLDQPLRFGQTLAPTTYPDRRLAFEHSWLWMVTSRRAKKAIEKAIRQRDQEPLIARGIEIFTSTFKEIMNKKGERAKLNEAQLRTLAEIIDTPIDELLSYKQQKTIAREASLEDFEMILRNIGAGVASNFGAGKLVRRVKLYYDLLPPDEIEKNTESARQIRRRGAQSYEKEDGVFYELAILGAFRIHHQFADCCKDIVVGDEVAATRGQETSDCSIHKVDCVNLATKKTVWPCSWHQVAES